MTSEFHFCYRQVVRTNFLFSKIFQACDEIHAQVVGCVKPQFASSLLKQNSNSSQLNRLPGREQLWKWKRGNDAFPLCCAPQFTKIFNKHHLRNRVTMKLKMLWLLGLSQVQAPSETLAICSHALCFCKICKSRYFNCAVCYDHAFSLL